jgi:hypothetical protein
MTETPTMLIIWRQCNAVDSLANERLSTLQPNQFPRLILSDGLMRLKLTRTEEAVRHERTRSPYTLWFVAWIAQRSSSPLTAARFSATALQHYSCRHILIRGPQRAVSSERYERAPANISRCFSRPSGSIMHPSDDGLVSSFLSALLHGATATLHSVVGSVSRRR